MKVLKNLQCFWNKDRPTSIGNFSKYVGYVNALIYRFSALLRWYLCKETVVTLTKLWALLLSYIHINPQTYSISWVWNNKRIETELIVAHNSFHSIEIDYSWAIKQQTNKQNKQITSSVPGPFVTAHLMSLSAMQCFWRLRRKNLVLLIMLKVQFACRS